MIKELVDTGTAELRDTPICMDIDGTEVFKKYIFQYKVTHNVLYPDYFFLMNVVGINLNQKGDGNIGSQLIMCKIGTTPQ